MNRASTSNRPIGSRRSGGIARRLRRPERLAFSLLELVVVIGIIVLLAALVLAVGTGLLTQSEARETRNAIQLFDSAVEEWERSRGRAFTYGTNGQPVPAPGFPAPQYDIQQPLAAQNAALRQMIVFMLDSRFLGGDEGATGILKRIDGSLLRAVPNSNPQETEFVDAWSNRIIPVFPGREWKQGLDSPVDQDEDGTIRTPVEKRMGSCLNRKLRLVSSGPDGVIGDDFGNATERAEAADNVHSYEPATP